MADEPRLPRTHLLWSALACVVFFLPLGLVAVGFGIGTQRAISRGDLGRARRRSRQARGWLIATIVIGIVFDLALAATLAALGAFSS